MSWGRLEGTAAGETGSLSAQITKHPQNAVSDRRTTCAAAVGVLKSLASVLHAACLSSRHALTLTASTGPSMRSLLLTSAPRSCLPCSRHAHAIRRPDEFVEKQAASDHSGRGNTHATRAGRAEQRPLNRECCHRTLLTELDRTPQPPSTRCLCCQSVVGTAGVQSALLLLLPHAS